MEPTLESHGLRLYVAVKFDRICVITHRLMLKTLPSGVSQEEYAIIMGGEVKITILLTKTLRVLPNTWPVIIINWY